MRRGETWWALERMELCWYQMTHLPNEARLQVKSKKWRYIPGISKRRLSPKLKCFNYMCIANYAIHWCGEMLPGCTILSYLDCPACQSIVNGHPGFVDFVTIVLKLSFKRILLVREDDWNSTSRWWSNQTKCRTHDEFSMQVLFSWKRELGLISETIWFLWVSETYMLSRVYGLWGVANIGTVCQSQCAVW